MNQSDCLKVLLATRANDAERWLSKQKEEKRRSHPDSIGFFIIFLSRAGMTFGLRIPYGHQNSKSHLNCVNACIIMQRMTSLDHFRALAAGMSQRDGANEQKTSVADYVADQLTAMGFTPQQQHFLGAELAYGPFILYAAVGLLSVILLGQSQPVGAAAAILLMATALPSLFLELQYRPNLLRWLLPIERSTNVIVHTPPAEDTTDSHKKIIVTAHIDGHRTPVILGVKVLSIMPLLIVASELAGAVLIVLAIIGVPISAAIVRQMALAPGLVFLALLVVSVLADRAPYDNSYGGDNAGGVAAVLGVIERLKDAPLKRAEAVFVFTGAEEAGAYGAQAFFESQTAWRAEAVHVVLCAVGAKGSVPTVIRTERFTHAVVSDAGLLAIADGIATTHTDLGMTLLVEVVGRNELSPNIVARAIGVTSVAGTPKSEAGSQLVGNGVVDGTGAGENVDADGLALQRHEAFLWELLHGIDAVGVK